MIKLLYSLIAVFLILSASVVAVDGADRAAMDSGQAVRPPAASPSTACTWLMKLIRLYQVRSRSHGNDFLCPSYPNCSTYAVQAVRRHGAALGWFIFVDRFWREASTVGKPPFLARADRPIHYDPLEQNDYWLDRARQPPKETPHYSPKLAGFLSAAVPGAGQWYVGRKMDAGLAFGFNAFFTLVTGCALVNADWPMVTILGMTEIGWYGGNVYNAANGAYIENSRYNRLQTFPE